MWAASAAGLISLRIPTSSGICDLFCLQAFAHVLPLRNYFLREENYAHIKPKTGDRLFILSKKSGCMLVSLLRATSGIDALKRK